MIYIDNRDWPEYNAKLVRRGEFYLDLSCVSQTAAVHPAAELRGMQDAAARLIKI